MRFSKSVTQLVIHCNSNISLQSRC